MRYVPIGRAPIIGLSLLLLVSVCFVSLAAEKAEKVVSAKVISLKGTIKVTKADGTEETLADTTKPIALPATIEMEGEKGSFLISLPTAISGKFNTFSWLMKKGEAVRVSLLKNNKGIRFEYLKGERNIFLDVNNREDIMVVNSVTGVTSVMVLQKKTTIPEKASILVTMPKDKFASVTVKPGQVSELEFSYSAVERLAIPFPEPETIEQSPYLPRP